MDRNSYDTDLTDEQWEIIEPLVRFDADGPGKRPTIPRREIMNAIRYLVRTGCSGVSSRITFLTGTPYAITTISGGTTVPGDA